MNYFSGSLSPNMRELDAIIFMDLSCNKIPGNIPSIIVFFQILSGLNLSKNSFQGDIPKSFGSLKGLDLLDFDRPRMY